MRTDTDCCHECLLLDLIARINSTMDLDSLLLEIMEAAKVITKAEASSLMMPDAQTEELVIMVPTGPVSREVSGVHIPRGEGFCGWVIHHGEPLIVSDAQSDPRFFGEATSGFHTRNLVCVPLRNPQGDVIGTLEAMNKLESACFTEEDARVLSAFADQSAIALERARLQQETVAKRLLEQELEWARDIQAGFWPKEPPHYDGICLAGVSVPATQVGGDYYDFIPLGESRCALVIGDISGKGVAAALLMAELRAVLRAQVEERRSPAEVMFVVNNMLVRNSPDEKFVTLFYGELDTVTRELTYVNAGHNPPLLYGRLTGQLARLETRGIAAGVVADAPYEVACEKLRPGEVMVLYTDGATDAQNRTEELFGEARFRDLVRQHAEEDAPTLLESLYQSVVDFTEGAPQYDDITLVVATVTE